MPGKIHRSTSLICCQIYFVFNPFHTYFWLGMLNDYRIFDYRIKCSFSFSFVTHSILGFSKYRTNCLLANARSRQNSFVRFSRLFLPAAVTPRPRVCLPSPSHSPYVQCDCPDCRTHADARLDHRRHARH